MNMNMKYVGNNNILNIMNFIYVISTQAAVTSENNAIKYLQFTNKSILTFLLITQNKIIFKYLCIRIFSSMIFFVWKSHYSSI